MEIKSTKNIALGMVKIECGHSGVGGRALKLAVFQKGINGINWL